MFLFCFFNVCLFFCQGWIKWYFCLTIEIKIFSMLAKLYRKIWKNTRYVNENCATLYKVCTVCTYELDKIELNEKCSNNINKKKSWNKKKKKKQVWQTSQNRYNKSMSLEYSLVSSNMYHFNCVKFEEGRNVPEPYYYIKKIEKKNLYSLRKNWLRKIVGRIITRDN